MNTTIIKISRETVESGSKIHARSASVALFIFLSSIPIASQAAFIELKCAHSSLSHASAALGVKATYRGNREGDPEVDAISTWPSPEMTRLSPANHLANDKASATAATGFFSTAGPAGFAYGLPDDPAADQAVAASAATGEKYSFTDKEFSTSLFNIPDRVSRKTTSVPEPAAPLLLLTGFLSLLAARKKMLQQQ